MWATMRLMSSLDGEAERMFGDVTGRECGTVRMEAKHRVVTCGEGGSVEVEMPGVSKEDVEVEVEHRVLKVTGKRYGRRAGGGENGNESGPTKGCKPAVVYSLQLRLGRDADTEKLRCESYKDGLMILKVPSLQKEAARKVNIE